jgi:hypothetical protein
MTQIRCRSTLGRCAVLGVVAVSALLVLGSCGGSSPAGSSGTPTPTPVVTPTPDPNIPPAGSGCGEPYPPKITRFNMKVQYKLRDYWIVDATPIIGPNALYCQTIGFDDGRQFCPVRPEGHPERAACELWRAGTSKDTPPRPGPTWKLTTKDGVVHLCTGAESGCDHFAPGEDGWGPFSIKVYTGGLYTVCAEKDGTCADLDVDRNL